MPKAKPKASKPMKLQANTAGAWKDVITFDGAEDHVTDEVMNNVHFLGIHDSGNASFRIIAIDPLIGVLARWTRAEGWKKEQRRAQR
ncbi:MAG: hypothetical protein QM569_14750 [Acidovorax sp.]|uniref:hypothetical protein n=1 Tax=Acidovorax sp. TaxID=1872122 RepID=UPI0039E5D08C